MMEDRISNSAEMAGTNIPTRGRKTTAGSKNGTARMVKEADGGSPSYHGAPAPPLNLDVHLEGRVRVGCWLP